MARPDEYKPEYCQAVIDIGAAGGSFVQMAVACGAVRDTLKNWQKKYPEFLAACARARELSLEWWEQQAQKGIWAGKAFNAKAWELSMQARFPDDYNIAKKTEITNPDGSLTSPTDPAAVAKRLEAIQRRAAQRKQQEAKPDGTDSLDDLC